MFLELTQKPHRKRPIELQLTAMIDIFSMIVIFLILGTVAGASGIVIPTGIQVPKSISKEGIEAAPRVTIDNGQVHASFVPDRLPLKNFVNDGQGEPHPSLASFQAKLHDFVEKIPKDARKGGTLLNVVADEKITYREIYHVVRLFREAGFDTILFVATGEAKKQ